MVKSMEDPPGHRGSRSDRSVDGYLLVLAFCYVRSVIIDMNRDLMWSSIGLLPVPGLQCFINICVVLTLIFGYNIGTSVDRYVQLRVKAKNVYEDFLATTKLEFAGYHKIILTNSCGVLHPVDIFLKRIYDKHFPRQSANAFAANKRTNPTLSLRLAQLEKYAEPNVESVPVGELEDAADEILTEAFRHPAFLSLAMTICKNVDGRAFGELKVDLSSASGYPYEQGRKKKEDRVHAEDHARLLLDDDHEFDQYVSKHVWYTTGRAKMQAVGDDDAGRLIIYSGYSFLLMALLALQPWCKFMNENMAWCGVGFSWMHGGAAKLAKYMECDKGFAPKGFRYVSLDISGWDNKLHRSVMNQLRRFYRTLLMGIGVQQSYVDRFVRLVGCMIDSPVLFPLGYLFKLHQGMKSGWAATGNDNTLLHEMIMRAIMVKHGYMKHVLYGDDNFLLVPDRITDEMLISEYVRFGLKIKYIHSSRSISDVDFLSKHIIYSHGHYYVYREAVETHSRLLMPEEMDPRRRDKPDAVVAAERVMGHLLDNPYNQDVRRICFKILTMLRDHYAIEYIDVHDQLIRSHPWRNFDTSLIPKRFPTVPSEDFIAELYGVPFLQDLRVMWPTTVTFIPNLQTGCVDMTLYRAAADFSNDVLFQLGQVASKKYKSIIRKLSPYAPIVKCYGFHAARFEFGIKYFGIEFSNILDLGAHPGACAASASKYCHEIVCVSTIPKDGGDFCPYVTRGTDVHCIIADADHFVPRKVFDLQHDDVDVWGASSVNDDIINGLGIVRRARMNFRFVKQALFTLKEIDGRTIDDLYDLYKDYGYIDYVKPLFSNPWKSEFMVYVRKEKTPRIRKAAFVANLYGFLNAMAPDLFKWSELLLNAISNYKGAEHIEPNPNQSTIYEDDWVRSWSQGKEHLSLFECSPLGANAHAKDLELETCSVAAVRG